MLQLWLMRKFIIGAYNICANKYYKKYRVLKERYLADMIMRNLNKPNLIP